MLPYSVAKKLKPSVDEVTAESISEEEMDVVDSIENDASVTVKCCKGPGKRKRH